MEQTDIQSLFREFAAPLGQYMTLGGRKEAVETLARNLWMAMLAGPAAEKELWEAMQGAAEVPGEFVDIIHRCYRDEMKPTVSAEQLAALRKHYGIRVADQG
jgi:hypothetical protein